MCFCPVSLETPGQLCLMSLTGSSSKGPAGSRVPSEQSSKSHLSHVGYRTVLAWCCLRSVMWQAGPHNTTLPCPAASQDLGPIESPSFLALRWGQLEPQGWALGPGAARVCFTLCSGTRIDTHGWCRGCCSRPGNCFGQQITGGHSLCSNLPCCPSCPPLSPLAELLRSPHLQNWRE